MNGLVTGGVKGLQRDISQNWVAFNFFLTRDCGWGARHCLGWAGPEGSWRQELSASHGHAEPQTGWPVRCRQRAGNGTRELTCLLPAIKQQSHTSWHGDTDNKAGRDTPDRSASFLHRCRAVPTDRQTGFQGLATRRWAEGDSPCSLGLCFLVEDPSALQPAHRPPGETTELRHKTRTSGFYFWLCCWQFTTFLHFPICYLGIMRYC